MPQKIMCLGNFIYTPPPQVNGNSIRISEQEALRRFKHRTTELDITTLWVHGGRVVALSLPTSEDGV